MKKQITLKELSKILSVSISTVSKALNDSYEISEKTKKRVKEVAESYNYQPNSVAVNLKSGKTYTIGVVIPTVQNFFLSRVLYGIEETIANTKYNTLICLTKESSSREKHNVEKLSNGLVDGFIIATSEETQVLQSYDHFKQALNRGKPIVMFDRVVKSLQCDKVIVNDYEAIYNACKQFILSGLKNILLVTTIHNLSVGVSRINGYKAAVKTPKMVKGNRKDIEEKLHQFLEKNSNFDAIIALDEESSLASLRVCKKLHLEIPKNISVIGYTSSVMAENLTPRLTTINQHGFTVGKKAAEMLVQKLANKETEKKYEPVESTLDKRDSTKL